jgi:hypothetical protein
VSEDDDGVGGEIKTSVAFVINVISEENTPDGHGCQFVSGFHGEIGIVGAIKHVQVLI